MNPSTLLVSHRDCVHHDTGPEHPESAKRLISLLSAVDEGMAEFDGRVARIECRHASEDEIGRVHPRSHIERIRSAVQQAGATKTRVFLDPDTAVAAGSWDAARAAAGSVITAVDGLLNGEAENAFCAVRPPGHHATADRAMGFCLFNNVAIGVRHARERGLDRALVIDWDVHHGNGTEAIFYEDGDVYYISMHQSPHYPGTGHTSHRGHGPGQGKTLNLPVPPGLPAVHYVKELKRGLAMAVANFKPEIIFISAGFDAAYGDPLAGLTLGADDFYALTRHVKEIAEKHCDNRVVSVLEGGYELDMLVDCSLDHIRALAGIDLS